MSCSRYETSIFLHAHHQLTGVRRWLAESHLHACPVCRARWAQWSVERDQLRRAFSPLPPDPAHLGGVTASVAARIRVERPTPAAAPTPRAARSGAPTQKLAVALAVLALLAAGISAFASFWQPPPAPCPTDQLGSHAPRGADPTGTANATCPPAGASKKPVNNTQPAPLLKGTCVPTPVTAVKPAPGR